MTTSFNDTLAYLETSATAASEAPHEGKSKRAHPLLLNQKRSLGRYAVDWHLHSKFEQLIVCERGSGAIAFEGVRHSFNGPAILVVPSVRLHALSFDENSERWVVSIARNYFQELAQRTPDLAEIFSCGHCIQCTAHERDYVELQHVLEKLDWEQRRSARCQEIVTEALLIDVLVAVLRRIQDSKAPELDANVSDQDVHRNFTTMVEAHHTENWSLQQYADALRITVPRLRAVCHSVTGESPIRIINSRILLEAKRALTHTNLSVSEIATQLGFEDASYFSRFFKSRCGETPTVYKASKSGLRRILEQDRAPEVTPEPRVAKPRWAGTLGVRRRRR